MPKSLMLLSLAVVLCFQYSLALPGEGTPERLQRDEICVAGENANVPALRTEPVKASEEAMSQQDWERFWQVKKRLQLTHVGDGEQHEDDGWGFDSRRVKDFTKADAKLLLEIHNLVEVWLVGKMIDGDVVAMLSKIKTLRKIRIESERLDDKAVEALATIPKLNSLFLSGDGMSDVALGRLSKLAYLADLTICSNRISDAGLENLSELTHLTDLTISSNKVTVKGLSSITKIQSLSRISFVSDKLTLKEAKEVFLSLPKFNRFATGSLSGFFFWIDKPQAIGGRTTNRNRGQAVIGEAVNGVRPGLVIGVIGNRGNR
ncbi:MAG: hypothetical protein HQ567_08335, partial [Candidatus Nealsonbacteria bacterium]|nr:hypothetical protein [Candidatus Nealsonbacteria bacterium]